MNIEGKGQKALADMPNTPLLESPLEDEFQSVMRLIMHQATDKDGGINLAAVHEQLVMATAYLAQLSAWYAEMDPQEMIAHLNAEVRETVELANGSDSVGNA